MNILVTGGAGYIGSVLVEDLVEKGHRVVVYDNLSSGHREVVDPRAEFVLGDLHDGDLLKAALKKAQVEAVIHMAASSLVDESVQQPKSYYDNNVVAGRILLQSMTDASVRKIVFSSTAAVYGEPERLPIAESDPCKPTNPYGETKLEFEGELEHFRKTQGINYASLRYFNAAGASKRCGELHEPETHLIPLVLRTAMGLLPHINVFGDDYPTRDGTCIRDYIHVVDLARAHILALDILGDRSEIYNIGCGGAGYTVREVIDCARVVMGLEIIERVAARRPGDPAVLVASSDKIKEDLDWRPEFQDLNLIVDSAWKWLRQYIQRASA